MEAFLELFDESGNVRGLINVNNIEEVWLNEDTDCVSIRYRSPNGKLIDHEEYFVSTSDAQFRYLMIEGVLVQPNRILNFERLKNRLKRSGN